MSIQIIDGFKLNLSSPIDDRIVASGSTARDNISYKYNGLRVFDLYDNIPYVWRNGTSGLKWYKENESALSILPNVTFQDNNGQNSTKTQFPKLSGNNNVTNSSLEETFFKNTRSRVVTIGYDTIPSDETAKLQVKGNVLADSFIGIGKDLTQINGVNLLNNSVTTDKISPGGEDFVLVTKNGQVEWVEKGQISKSSQTSFDAISSEENYVPFKLDANSDLKISNSFKYKPSTKQLLLSSNTKSSPSISFMDEPNTGIYRISGNQIGISINSSDKLTIDTNGVKILPGSIANPGISFIGSNTSGFYYSNTDKKIGISINTYEVLNIARYSSGAIVLNLNYTSTIPILSNDTYYILSNKLNIISDNISIKTNYSSDFGFYVENNSPSGLGLSIRNKGGESLRLVGHNTNNFLSFYDASITSGTYTTYLNSPNPNWGLRTAWIGTYGDNLNLVIQHQSTSGNIQHKIGNVVKMETNNNGVRIGTNGSIISKIYTGYIAMTTNPSVSAATWVGYEMPSGFSTSMPQTSGFNSGTASVTITHPVMNTKFAIWNISISQEVVAPNCNNCKYGHLNKISHSVSSSSTSTTIYLSVVGGWKSIEVSGLAFKFSVMDFS